MYNTVYKQGMFFPPIGGFRLSDVIFEPPNYLNQPKTLQNRPKKVISALPIGCQNEPRYNREFVMTWKFCKFEGQATSDRNISQISH